MLPTYFLFQIFVLGRRKTQGKREHCVPWTIHFGKEEPGPIFCLSSKCEGCSAQKASLPFLVNFKFLLQRCRLGSQGRREKRPLKKGSKSYCRNKKLLPKGRERELFAHHEGSTPRLHKAEACPGQEMDSYTAGRRRVWGLEEKIHPRAFLRSVVKQGRAASGQLC